MIKKDFSVERLGYEFGFLSLGSRGFHLFVSVLEVGSIWGFENGSL